MVTILRTLTHKSIIGFGKHYIKNLSVQELIHTCQQYELVKMYYKLGKITFTEEVLIEIGIKPEWRIVKPGKDYEALSRYNHLIIDALRAKTKADGLTGMRTKLENGQEHQNRMNTRRYNNARESKGMMQKQNHDRL